MEQRVMTYRSRSRSRERRFERRFEERPSPRRLSHERSPCQSSSPPRRRQFSERGGDHSPVGLHNRRGVSTRRFTERPRNRSPSFEMGSYEYNSPGRDTHLISKQRKFKESPDRSPINPYSNLNQSAGRRHFSPDTFATKSDAVVDRKAERDRFSSNTLTRIGQLHKGTGNLFPSELDKLKGYESPEYSDNNDGDDYGLDTRNINSRNDTFYEEPRYEALSKTDNLVNQQPQPKDRFVNIGNSQITNTYRQMDYKDIDPQGGAYQYEFIAGSIQYQVGNMNTAQQMNSNFDDQRTKMLFGNQERPGLESPQLSQNQQYVRQDMTISGNNNKMYDRENDTFIPSGNGNRVRYSVNDKRRDQDYYKGDNQIVTRKRPMDRSDFGEDDVKFRRSDYSQDVGNRFLQPQGIQPEGKMEADRNRSHVECYPGQFNPNMESLSVNQFSGSHINKMQAAANINPDRKRELDLLLSQSKMLNQRINNIISNEINQGDLQMSGVNFDKMSYSGTVQKQPERLIDKSQYDWGYNPPWRQSEPLPRKPNIPEWEQEFKPARQPSISKQPLDDDYEEDDAYMSRNNNAPRVPSKQNAPWVQGQQNAPSFHGQPNIIPGFQQPAQSRNPGHTFASDQSRISDYENKFLPPEQSFNPVHKNLSGKIDREIAAFQQHDVQRNTPEYQVPQSRQANVPKQINNMQQQRQFFSRPSQAGKRENESPITRYSYGAVQKQTTQEDEQPVAEHPYGAAQKAFAQGYKPHFPRYQQGKASEPIAREKEPPRYPKTATQKFSREKDPPHYPQTMGQKFVREKQPPRSFQKVEERLDTRDIESPKHSQNISQKPDTRWKTPNRNAGQNLQQTTSRFGKSQAPKTSEHVKEIDSFVGEKEELGEWTENNGNEMETDLDAEEKSKAAGPIQKNPRFPDEVEFQANGRWLGVSKIRWNIKPNTAQTKVVVKKKDGPILFIANGTNCIIEDQYKDRIEFHGDTTLGTLNFDLHDCCFADEGLYIGSYDNRIFNGPNLKLWTYAIEGETALVLFKMPKMPPNEKVTVYKKNGDTFLIAWGTNVQFTDKYKGKLQYFGDTEKGLIVFSIKNTIQTQSGIYMASVGNNSYEGRQLKVDLPPQKKKRKKKYATSAVKEKGITDLINFLKQKSKDQNVEPSSLNRLANYNSVPLYFDYKSIPGPADSKYITGTICAYEDLYLAKMSGKSKDEVRRKMLERALSNLLSKTYSQLVQNSFKELELPISLLSNQISKGILQLGGEIAKIPPIKKETVKPNIVIQKKPETSAATTTVKQEQRIQKKPVTPTVKQEQSIQKKPATPATTTTTVKQEQSIQKKPETSATTTTVKQEQSSPSKPAATVAVKKSVLSKSGDIKTDLLHAKDEEAKGILTSMATSADISNSVFLDSIGSMKNRKGVDLQFLLKTVSIREKFKMESGLGESSEKIRTTNNVFSNLISCSVSEQQQVSSKPLEDLIIFYDCPKEELVGNAYEILLESTKTCVMHLQWHSKHLIPASRGILPVTVCRCFVWVQGKLFGDAVTVGGKVGRQLAAAQALVHLIKQQPVIQFVELENQGSFCVTIEEAQRRAEVLKEQEGLTKQPDGDDSNKLLSRVCEDIILQYSTEPTLENLEFQPGFPKKVLLDIKKLCDKHKLTFKAYLKDKEYINVVCKNLNPKEILSLLQQNDRKSGKYRLVPKEECEAIAEEMMSSLTDDLYLNPNPFDM